MDKEENKISGAKGHNLTRREAIGSLAAMSAGAVIPGMAINRENDQVTQKESSPISPPPVYSLNRPGNSRQFTTFNQDTKQKAFPIQPGEKKTLVNYDGAG